MSEQVPPDHVHISQREPGPWEDCLWDSALEWYRLCIDARKPATHAEAQLLRRASGEPETGGSNMGNLERGLKARYGYALQLTFRSYSALRSALSPGKSAVVTGSMRAFGPSHRLSQWLGDFDAGHAVHIMNIDGTLLWCDPLAPTTADVPVEVTWAEVRAYVTALPGAEHVVAVIRNLTPKEVPMPNLTSYIPGHIAKVKPTANIRLQPTLKSIPVRVSGGETWTVFGTVKGDIDPNGGSDQWYLRWAETRYEYTAKSNVTSITAPVTDCTAAVTAATGLLKAQVSGLTDQLRKAAADLLASQKAAATAAEGEQERIAIAEAARIRAI